ncbi:dimethlysulfonioproprionate lyase DddL [Pseudooceanicola lipolyticus]|uniref:Dimethlysulfonioproprionate lyase DddL n=1 Tax=Pseudooceanicola lipolyticus TaxID=2029104 RepID=A0A2M8IXX3_9RHOB|nr:dimethylsulfonioproprionate lyase family protein [Pseudooceanicola lipolyticus]PJE35362.1 dimethlysulfonioproprionate lyase DddL [Pseudooceanicola lipolyticus]
MTRTLSDSPGWQYLLREFDMLYRYGSAGGSRAIRSHRKRVRDRLAAITDRNPVLEMREPLTKPVVEHLHRALDLGEVNDLNGMCRALRRVQAGLTWEYGYERVPKALEKKYAYCEVMGPRGPVMAEGLILGFVLFAPKTTYPQHSHSDIEESYVSVSGAWSENETAVFAPGSMILNRSGQEHRITTGEYDPCLLAYAWIGPEERLSAPGMRFSATRRAGRSKTPGP